MDLFVKRFKEEIPYTYPLQNGFLPKLGLCGTTSSDGIFDSEETLITDKVGIESIIIVKTERWDPAVKEFSNIKNTQWVSNFETEGKFVVKSTEIKGNVFFKLLDFESKEDFYYRAIHLRRDYIYNPKDQLENFIRMALKDGRWRNNGVVITSILYGKNPIILKATEKEARSTIGGEISVGLSFSDINLKVGLIHKDKSISKNYNLDPDKEVAVGFQMMGLKGYIKKQFEKLRGEDINNAYDIFDFSENENDMEYALEYV
jgi:hypothetical protein